SSVAPRPAAWSSARALTATGPAALTRTSSRPASSTVAASSRPWPAACARSTSSSPAVRRSGGAAPYSNASGEQRRSACGSVSTRSTRRRERATLSCALTECCKRRGLGRRRLRRLNRALAVDHREGDLHLLAGGQGGGALERLALLDLDIRRAG